MKKLLFMIINMNLGGTEKALLNMISEIPKDKFEITILMLEQYGELLEFIPDGVKIKYLDYYVEIKEILNKSPLDTTKELIKSRRYIKGLSTLLIHALSKIIGERSIFYKYVLRGYPAMEEKYDIAVAYAGPMEFISYFVTYKIKSNKKVQWVHFDVSKIGINKKFTEKIFSKFNKVFVVSNEGKNKLVKLCPKIKNKVDVFNNVISSNLIVQQSHLGEGFNDRYDGIKILTVGRLTKEKGQDLCIETLELLKSNGYNVRWYCVGNGSYRNNYERMVKKKQLEDDFIFLGSKINPYTYMRQCDIYVQPSRHEGYCITLAEARSFNNPIITTNFTGASEQIKNNDTGIIVEFNKYEMYTAIKNIIDDKELKNIIMLNLKNDNVNTLDQVEKLFSV